LLVHFDSAIALLEDVVSCHSFDYENEKYGRGLVHLELLIPRRMKSGT
jgi:hypothetical protein